MTRLVIITGASKGIGAQIALQTNAAFNSSTFLLIARNLTMLDEVKDKMAETENQNEVITLAHDFSKSLNIEKQKTILKTSLPNDKSYDELYVFYNHGTLKLECVEKVADSATSEFQINVVSIWILMAALRDMFPSDLVPKQYHINISSLLATLVQPMCSLYSSTRIARATIFKSLAIEQPNLRVLNYQPGPVYTDMLKQIFEERKQIMPENESFGEDYQNNKLVKAETTVERMLEIIKKDQFENGASIDYFDEF